MNNLPTVYWQTILMVMENTKQIGEYTIIERIGRGGMSEVYRAKSASGQDVALKLLKFDPTNPEEGVFLARFRQEARIIAELDHPHILPMLDYGDSDIGVYIVMPLIDGGTLADVIRRGPLSPEAAVFWLSQIASALDHAHKVEVIHRDLKPTNVLLNKDGNAFLTDFGIAKLSNLTGDLTETGHVLGTPAYMAPEQWKDEALHAYTDVYGLGVMTYLMLTGHTPFESETPHAMMYQHLDQRTPPLRTHTENISPAVEQVVMKALEKDPQNRYVSAGAFAEDFRMAIEGKPTLAAATVPPTPIRTGIQIPYPPPPSVPPYRYRMPETPAGQRALWRQFFVLSTLAFALIFIGIGAAIFIVGGDALFGDSDKAPAATPRSLDVPRIRLDSPLNDSLVLIGQSVIIQVTVFDEEGVTRVELYEGNTLIQVAESANPNGQKPVWTVQFEVIPEQSGERHFEILAFRGAISSDPRVLNLKVQ